jgi:choline kinase
MTKAIILAAGRGSRMGSETSDKPKCLTVLNNKTLLEWQLSSLKQAGINDVELVTGYKSELLKQYASQTHLNPDWAKTNMVSSLFCAPPPLSDIIISYSDIVYSSEHIDKLKKSKHDIVITADMDWFKLWSLRFINPLEDAETFSYSGNSLVSIGQKTDDLKAIQAQFMGLLKLTQKGWIILFNIFQKFPDDQRRKMDMTTLLAHLLEYKVHVGIEFIEGKWCECDTYDDVLVYERTLKEIDNWTHDWRT